MLCYVMFWIVHNMLITLHSALPIILANDPCVQSGGFLNKQHMFDSVDCSGGSYQ